MIYLYTGTPGSGKSYHAAEVINRALRRGMPILANFEINYNPKRHKGDFVYIPTLDLSPDYFKDYAVSHFKAHKEGQGLIIIDEAQIPFNSRDGLNRSRMKWIEFFSTHRHYGYDIILITQMDRMIDRQVRGLVEIEFKHRKLTNYGAKGLFMIIVFRKVFVAVKYWYPIQEKIESEFFNCHKRVYTLYDTFKHFDKPQEESTEDMKSRIAAFNNRKELTS